MSAPQQGGLPPRLAVAFTSAAFFAVLIAGFGVLSLLSDTEVLPVSGLGQVPGIAGTALAVIAFVAGAAGATRGPRPRFGSVAGVVVVSFLGYLLGVLIGAVLAGVDVARAVAAVGAFATSWFAVVLAVAAGACAWTAVALVRTHAGRPRWPWEHDEP